MGVYRISGWFVCHDAKYTGSVELVVERAEAPPASEAEPLLWPLADAQLERMYPGESGGLPWRTDFISVNVREEPPRP